MIFSFILIDRMAKRGERFNRSISQAETDIVEWRAASGHAPGAERADRSADMNGTQRQAIPA